MERCCIAGGQKASRSSTSATISDVLLGPSYLESDSKAESTTLMPLRAFSPMYSPRTLCSACRTLGIELAHSSRYLRGRSAGVFAGSPSTSLEVVDAYSEVWIASLVVDWADEATMEGITVSPMAIRVAHCDSVRNSPTGGGGIGLSRGAIRDKVWLAMVDV